MSRWGGWRVGPIYPAWRWEERVRSCTTMILPEVTPHAIFSTKSLKMHTSYESQTTGFTKEGR